LNLEIKSQDPRIYETASAGPQSAHKFQVIQSMGLVRKRTKYRPESGILIYFNTSFVTQYRPYVIPYAPTVDEALRKRAISIMNGAWTVDAPPPAEGLAEGGKECQYCPWREMCTLKEIGRLPTDIKTVPPNVANKLHELALMRKEMLVREQDAEASKKAVDAEIIEILSRHETKRVQAEWGSLSVHKSHSPPVVLRDKLETEVGKDRMREFFRDGTPYIRITVALK
jgi:hypothetical protein